MRWPTWQGFEHPVIAQRKLLRRQQPAPRAVHMRVGVRLGTS